ncbi:MAG: sialidase family protein [Promethearchaeota archaeon]
MNSISFLHEEIKLENENLYQFKFVQLPNGDWLLQFISRNANKFQFMKKRHESNGWNLDIPHNLHYKNNHKNKTINNNDTESDVKSDAESGEKIKDFTLFYDNKGDLICLFNVSSEDNPYYLYQTISSNYGKNWSTPINISQEFESWRIHSSPILLKNISHLGNFIVPVENPLLNRTLILLSKNNAKSWHFSLFVEPPEDEKEEKALSDNEMISGTHSPIIFEGENEKIVMLCRSVDHTKFYRSESNDLGMTWSESEEQFIADFAPKGAIDGLKLNKSKKNDEKAAVSPSNFVILGSVHDENKSGHYMQLWKSADEGYIFNKIWQSSEKLNEPCPNCQVYQDNQDCVHLLYKTPQGNIHHNWEAEAELFHI